MFKNMKQFLNFGASYDLFCKWDFFFHFEVHFLTLSRFHILIKNLSKNSTFWCCCWNLGLGSRRD